MSIRNVGLLVFMTLGIFLSAQPASAGVVVLLAGNIDGYALPVDPTSPSTTLVASVPSCGTAGKGFDDPAINSFVCTTFNLTPFAGHIKSAILDFNARPENDIPSNDAINLFNNGALFYTAFLAALSGTSWLFGIGPTAFSIDVTSLVTSPGFAGFLDFVIQDDTTVDFARLTINVSEPSTLILAAIGLSGLAVSVRRRRNSSSLRHLERDSFV
ncbi:MAG: PEP-CTERM sorting domain-containing protein [Acidobacteriota bacterium]|nr:PEP-CTERM sorting domain-containing protein [Acidobacteriota bacterium]